MHARPKTSASCGRSHCDTRRSSRAVDRDARIRKRRACSAGAGEPRNDRQLRGSRGHDGHEHRSHDGERKPRVESGQLGHRVPARPRERRGAERGQCCGGAGAVGSGHCVQRRRRADARDYCGRGHPRRADADRRRLQRRGPRPDRNPHARRAGRQRGRLHLPGGVDAHHRVGESGEAGQRRLAVQRLLAGRKLSDARDYHELQGDDPRPHVHRAEHRRHGGRQAAGP